MTEIAFAKQFLTALDSRATKLSSDHVADPKSYPAQPAYILPRHPSSPLKRKRTAQSTTDTTAASSTAPTINVSLKSLKGPSQSIILSDQPLTASVFDLKTAYAMQTGYPADKVRLLYARKPTSDSKTIAEVAGLQDVSGIKEVELSVMIMGGATPNLPAAVASSPAPVNDDVSVAQGPSGEEVLKTDEFWSDLKAFLLQRLRDEKEGERLVGLFKVAWEKDKA